MNTLVIVESPAKARTIEKFLGPDYQVEASVGHVRDLAQPSELPDKEKHGPFAKFAVNIENDFEPYYLVNPDKKRTVSQLKKILQQADRILLATDEDREGEAIAWHLLEVLKPKVPVSRMVFHEITKDAITRALENTRDINQGLVDAQETRRIIDRLVGYEISPLLWRKIAAGLSAGRVQSVATRLVVERERARRAFKSANYWGLQASVNAQNTDGDVFTAAVISVNGKNVATGRDFGDDGELSAAAKKKETLVLDEQSAKELQKNLSNSSVIVSRVETKPYKRRPSAPFTTSTLQQEASRKLRMSTRDTMSTAQRLYENGYITYMRTDSTALSVQAANAARQQAKDLYGEKSIPEIPRVYEKKAKGAQEAHEAIRPAGENFRHPKDLKDKLSPGEYSLYELIWKRTIASQMIDATGKVATILLQSEVSDSKQKDESAQTVLLRASGTVITEPGFRQVYEEGKDSSRYDAESKTNEETNKLPDVEMGQECVIKSVEAEGHNTRPPERYTDATLVKKMEELGIGRPSTYASTISRIEQREYVVHQGQALIPTWLAFSVVRLLEENLPDLVDYAFTAEMEEELDKIAAGEEGRVSYLSRFWHGEEGRAGLEKEVADLGDIDAKAVNSIAISENITLRVGKFGPYVEKILPGGETPLRATVPPDLTPDELTQAKAEELLSQTKEEDKVLGIHPETGLQILVKAGRFGPYVQEELPSDAPSKAKPRTASLFKDMSIDTLTLEQAVKLLSLPRLVGKTTEGEEIQAQNGRFGPYLTKGKDTRSLEAEEDLFTITLAEAEQIFAQPKTRRGAKKSNTLSKELGVDPVSGGTVFLRDGRFGPYVTDGSVNASIRTTDSIDTITPERAYNLLSLRREKLAETGGKTKRGATSKTRKSAITKKSATPKKTTSKAKKATVTKTKAD